MDLGNSICSVEKFSCKGLSAMVVIVAFYIRGVLPALYRWLCVGTRVRVGYKFMTLA